MTATARAFRREIMRVAREAYIGDERFADVLWCPHCYRRRVRAVAYPVVAGLVNARVECAGCEVSWSMSITEGDLGWRYKLVRAARRLGFGGK